MSSYGFLREDGATTVGEVLLAKSGALPAMRMAAVSSESTREGEEEWRVRREDIDSAPCRTNLYRCRLASLDANQLHWL
jgi:hypothetical protein